MRTARALPIVLATSLAVLLSPALADTTQTPAVSWETRSLRLQIAPDTGGCEIIDRRTGVVWRSNPRWPRLGEATVLVAGKSQRVQLGRCEAGRSGGGLVATFRLQADQPQAALHVQLRPLDEGSTLECSYDADPGLRLDGVRLLEDVLSVTDTETGYAVVPVREGLLVPADSGVAFTHRFDSYAYEGCHLTMFGLVKAGAAALVTWTDPYAAAELRSTVSNTPAPSPRQVLSASLLLRKSARSFQIQFLGPGDHNTVAQAYRRVAKERGWLVTWDQKLRDHPERARLFGASNFKLWSALDRQMNDDSTKEERVRVNWTFDEAAQVAEHLKQDLKLDRVLFLMGGWIHRGYDNQHPDILPAAPECGGDPGLADCARRVRRLGYLFGLHDNYQDIYRDSPSWSQALIMKTSDGQLAKGGKWAGGRAYLTCSQQALELARRPQNLAAVKKLSGADAYFIDTTYAAGLQECFDPAHPLTRVDDLRWKQALSDYARGLFGIFGSECGREWAIPHSDFFEGLTGVSGRHYHDEGLETKLGATVVPLFELVYRDCIALYGKYGYDPAQAARYVLHHLSMGRPLHYHSVPAHRYWLESAKQAEPPPVRHRPSDAAVFTRADRGWAEGMHPLDRFLKNTHEILSPLHELTARTPLTRHEFLTADRMLQRTAFGEGPEALTVVVNSGEAEREIPSKLGGNVLLPAFGFLVEGAAFVAFHARRWDGLRYEAPALFTLRSLDGQPLDHSRRVRVFHGFGDVRLRFRGTTQTIEREELLLGHSP